MNLLAIAGNPDGGMILARSKGCALKHATAPLSVMLQCQAWATLRESPPQNGSSGRGDLRASGREWSAARNRLKWT